MADMIFQRKYSLFGVTRSYGRGDTEHTRIKEVSHVCHMLIQTQGKANEGMDQASLFVVSKRALGGSVTPYQDCGEQQYM